MTSHHIQCRQRYGKLEKRIIEVDCPSVANLFSLGQSYTGPPLATATASNSTHTARRNTAANTNPNGVPTPIAIKPRPRPKPVTKRGQDTRPTNPTSLSNELGLPNNRTNANELSDTASTSGQPPGVPDGAAASHQQATPQNIPLAASRSESTGTRKSSRLSSRRKRKYIEGGDDED